MYSVEQRDKFKQEPLADMKQAKKRKKNNSSSNDDGFESRAIESKVIGNRTES